MKWAFRQCEAHDANGERCPERGTEMLLGRFDLRRVRRSGNVATESVYVCSLHRALLTSPVAWGTRVEEEWNG